MIEKWAINDLQNYLKEDRLNCYWFWFKGKYNRTRIKGRLRDSIVETMKELGEWNNIRLRNGFYNCFDILIDNYMRGVKEGKYNGQTKTEYEKNYKRVRDIVDKANSDVNRMIYLSQTQAAKITDEWKAVNRAMVAKELGYEEIFEVFFNRAYRLGSVSKQEFREYKLEKLGL
jgi:hypothetical protein